MGRPSRAKKLASKLPLMSILTDGRPDHPFPSNRPVSTLFFAAGVDIVVFAVIVADLTERSNFAVVCCCCDCRSAAPVRLSPAGIAGSGRMEGRLAGGSEGRD